jgi:para-nitrobenzyl esterase
VVGSNADEATLFTLTTPVRTELAFRTLVRSVYPAVADEVLALYPVAGFATPKDAYNALFSDVAFICPAVAFAEAISGGAEPAFSYHFTHTATGAASALGSFHGLELAYVFDNYDPRYTPTDADLRVRDAMQGAWTSFAHDGAPTTTPAWPAAAPTSTEVFLFGDPPSVATEIRGGRCAELERLGIVQ